jgi:hypothetical protein
VPAGMHEQAAGVKWARQCDLKADHLSTTGVSGGEKGYRIEGLGTTGGGHPLEGKHKYKNLNLS